VGAPLAPVPLRQATTRRSGDAVTALGRAVGGGPSASKAREKPADVVRVALMAASLRARSDRSLVSCLSDRRGLTEFMPKKKLYTLSIGAVYAVCSDPVNQTLAKSRRYSLDGP
jgi:hypothetical protein